MIIENTLDGKYVYLRSVEINDADFIVKIRNDDSKNKFIHPVPNDIEKQKVWINNQIQSNNDYYFVVKDNDNNSVGLASIYDVNLHNGGAEFGRWVSWGSSIQNVETVLLAFDFAFNTLEIDYIYTRTMVENNKVKRFWKQLGAENVGDVYEMDMWLNKSIVTKDLYYRSIRDKMTRLLKY